MLEPNKEGFGVLDSILRVDGSGRKHLHQKAGGSVKPPTHETIDNKEHFIYQEGQAVFKFAVKGMADVSAEIMERNNLKSDDVAWLVPHQANKRIIDATASRMGVGNEKVMLNIQRYGNTTSGTISLRPGAGVLPRGKTPSSANTLAGSRREKSQEENTRSAIIID